MLSTDGLPVQIVKDRSTGGRTRRGSTPRSPMRSVLESHRASRSPVPTHGADGDRTHDLRLAKPALSQLSYSPLWKGNTERRESRRAGSNHLCEGGSSLPSSSGVARAPVPLPSSGYFLLRYGGLLYRLGPVSDQDLVNFLPEWAQVESNYRPYPYQGYALAN